MSASKPLAKLDEHGVPHCTGARCPHHTPKQRCAITGESVERVCAPAVRELVTKLADAERLAESRRVQLSGFSKVCSHG